MKPNRLTKTLNAIAPGKVIIERDDEYHAILKRGKLIEATSVEYLEGERHRCHRNAALHYLLHFPFHKIVTGFGYTNEIWFRHSWLQTGDEIFETTESFDFYFGVILDDKETAKFVLDEVFPLLPGMKELLAQPMAS